MSSGTGKFKLCEENSAPYSSIPVTAKRNRRAGNNDLSLAKLWIERSLTKANTHAFPTQSSSVERESLLPTRILDLAPGILEPGIKRKVTIFTKLWGPKRDVRRDVRHDVRLVCPKIGSRGQYVTLSHRWGSSHHLLTTKSTFTSHCDKIHFTALPKTFQDVVICVRELGYRYLWIDALCIYSSRSGIKGSRNQQPFIQHRVIFDLTFFNLALTIYNR